jgi:hypothetical protein
MRGWAVSRRPLTDERQGREVTHAQRRPRHGHCRRIRFTEIQESGAPRPRVDGAAALSAYYDRRVLEHAPGPPRAPQPRWGQGPMTLDQTPEGRDHKRGAPRPPVWEGTRAGSGLSSRSIYPLRGVDRDEVADLLCRDGDKEGVPRPRVWDETAAHRAYYRPDARGDTRRGLLGHPPGVTGRTTKTVIYMRARKRRGGERPAPDMEKTTPLGVVRTG